VQERKGDRDRTAAAGGTGGGRHLAGGVQRWLPDEEQLQDGWERMAAAAAAYGQSHGGCCMRAEREELL
jgi:hypothetical protein